jgi:urea ABC transporter ATP-binding protein UrtD
MRLADGFAVTELLRTEALSKRFRGLLANDKIDFTLAAGEIRCVIGPNGAGKTTLISMISGHLSPSDGRIWFKGRDITELSLVRRAQQGIARKFQTPSVFDRLSVGDNLELAALGKAGIPRDRAERIEEILAFTRLADRRDVLASALSHGERQWLEIAMLLANRAELLLLDEPTAGMTAEETHATAELIRTLTHTHGLSIIIIEHDINFIRDLRAPVTVLHLGRILASGSFEDIAANDMVRNVYLGQE